MKVRVIGSTKPGFCLPVDEALIFSGHEAGICYMADDYDAIANEPVSRTLGRVRGTVGSGHHSVSGHVSYNLLLEGVPKIIAMLLNNEKDYNTSEKSARYTKMGVTDEDVAMLESMDVPLPSGEEKEIYEKWIGKFSDLISAEYPNIDSKTVDKLAKENARYFISVFTPATTMGYTVDLRQLNYLIGFCDDYASEMSFDEFHAQLKPWVIKLSDLLASVADVDGLRDNKGRKFSLFAPRRRHEEFGENYCTNYLGTFAQLAQAQRHRSLDYEMMVPSLDEARFFVPPIIEDKATRAEYLADMEKLKEFYPQGMLVWINERGTPENFALKCQERLCGAAQLEICHQTYKTLGKYIIQCARSNEDVHNYLYDFYDKTKCRFGHYHCDRPCPLGPYQVFTRKIKLGSQRPKNRRETGGF